MSDTSYARKKPSYFEQQRPEMVAYVPHTAQSVLELGCGGGAFAAHLKSQRSIRLVAVEAHAAAAATARPKVDRLICATIEDAVPQLAGEQFDCVVLNDVLEHLVDPWAALRQIHPLLHDQGVVVASIPNMRYFPVLKELVLKGRWEYQQQGVLDRTHLRFFTPQSMRDLFESTGYQVQTMQGIIGSPFPWKLGVVNKLFAGALADTQFPQFACVAAKSADTGQSTSSAVPRAAQPVQ